MKKCPLLAVGLISAIALTGCPTDNSSSSAPQPSQETATSSRPDLSPGVRVSRSAAGIPHIEAENFAGMGYGYGYVQAEDNLCLLAEDVLTIRGLRARYLGEDGVYRIPANGTTTSNREADFFWRSAATDEAIAPLKANAEEDVINASSGYVAGYNQYLQEIRNGEHPGRHAACRDAEWLLPMEEDDMFRRYYRLGVLASSSVFVDGIAGAQPPTGPEALPAQPEELLESLQGTEELPFPLGGELPIGSNMYALSGDTSRSGESMLLGNPHFPWEGTERLYMAHLTVGDEANIMGSALYGLPAVLIGFNEHFAWSHTVSTAFRFTFYELTLNPADPTQYLFEGEFVDMEEREITVELLDQDGEIREETRTLYYSHYGPMLEFEAAGIPILNWTNGKAYTLRDANAENDRLINQFFQWNKADSFEEFVELHKTVLGVPWVNTIATGPGKPAYYGDVTVVPNVPDSKVSQCATALTPVFGQLSPGLPVLDGSRAECAWDTDADAPAEGIFGPSNLPTLTRDDWVHNCNNSYWLSNPEEPVTGFAAIIGDEETPRSLRTRECITKIQDRLDGSDGRPGSNGFDLLNLQDTVLDATLHSERLARGSVLDAYCPLPTLPTSSGGFVETAEACAVLSAWDGTNELDSRGGHVWREFWRNINPLPADTLMWLTPFDAQDPVNTPRDLNVANPAVAMAFADAIERINNAGIALDAPLGEIQYSAIHEDFIPVAGGNGADGSFVIAFPRFTSLEQDNGYAVDFGNSYIQTVTWDDNGDPVAEGFVTYSQSTDPASPYFQNMTEAYAEKQWIRFPFTRQQQARDGGRERVQLPQPVQVPNPAN
ncbi:MAG: penicillin acylase family protein [Oleiphilaceae bacterium]|nr:penicillin acylase family protein [Oleiphilaceae bacterium]